MATRSDPAKHRAQVRAANRARYRAIQDLITENQARFDVLYAGHAEAEGVSPKPRGRIDVVTMQRQIAELEARLAKVAQPAESLTE